MKSYMLWKTDTALVNGQWNLAPQKSWSFLLGFLYYIYVHVKWSEECLREIQPKKY